MTRSERGIALISVGPEVRMLLAQCRLERCRRCKDGFEQFRGQRAIICKCSFELFREALEFQTEENERRRKGLPARMMEIRDRKLSVGDIEKGDVPATPVVLHPQEQLAGSYVIETPGRPRVPVSL